MSVRKLENISWYVDQQARGRREPGIHFSDIAEDGCLGYYSAVGKPTDPPARVLVTVPR